MAGDVRPGRRGSAWLANRFWLVLPPLLLNVALLMPLRVRRPALATAILFTAVHTVHAAIIWSRTAGVATPGV